MSDLKILRERTLSDVPSDKAFWTCNGTICRNIYELVNNIRALNECAFRYHVNNDHQKNDFAKWVGEVLGDDLLAIVLNHIMEKDRYVDIIERRIKELEEA